MDDGYHACTGSDLKAFIRCGYTLGRLAIRIAEIDALCRISGMFTDCIDASHSVGSLVLTNGDLLCKKELFYFGKLLLKIFLKQFI